MLNRYYRVSDPSEQTPAQRNQKRLARNETSRKAGAKGQWKSRKLFNIHTGKPAPEGASPSEQYITFKAYVHRHVEAHNIIKTTYVNAKTGELADGITRETHQRGQHTTLYIWLVRQKYKELSKILKEGGDLPLPPLSKRNNQQKKQAADKRNASHPLPTPLNTPLGSNLAGACDASVFRIAEPSEQKRQAYNEAQKQVRTKEPPLVSKLFDIYTGKPAPIGASKSEQYITFCAYVKRHVKAPNPVKTTYVNAKTGVPADGITKETHKRGQHTTLYTWKVSQKFAEFSNILDEGGVLPPALPRNYQKRQKTQAADKQKAHRHPARSNVDLPRAEASSASTLRLASPSLPTAPLGTSLCSNSVDAADNLHSSLMTSEPAAIMDPATSNPLDPAIPLDITSSTASNLSVPILPPVSHPLPTLLNTPLSSNPAGVFAASHRADRSEQTLAQIKTLKRLAHNEADRKAYAEGRRKSSKLFNIDTGKPAPKEASPSEHNITLKAYVYRHIEATNLFKTTYVNAKTGVPADGVTKETHKQGQHTTLYTWKVSQKYAEFLKILDEGGTLPPAPSRQKHKRKRAQAAYKQNTHRAPARSNVVRPRAEAASASAGRHSSLTASGHAAVESIETGKPLPLLEGLTAADLALDRSFLTPATPSTSADTTPSAVTSVSTPILPPASHPLASPLDMSLNSNPDEAFDASAHSILSPMISSTDQASPLPSLDLEEWVDHMLSAESPFTAGSDASVLASLTESDLTAKTATTTGEPFPLLSENPIQKQVESDLDLSFSEPVTTRPAFSALPTTPLYPYSAEAADAVTHPGLDPEISAEQDSFKQDTRQKRKPNVHFFFQPKENDRVGPASRKAKTMPSDGSVEHPLPEADTSDSISEVLFIPSLAAKRPAF